MGESEKSGASERGKNEPLVPPQTESLEQASRVVKCSAVLFNDNIIMKGIIHT